MTDADILDVLLSEKICDESGTWRVAGREEPVMWRANVGALLMWPLLLALPLEDVVPNQQAMGGGKVWYTPEETEVLARGGFSRKPTDRRDASRRAVEASDSGRRPAASPDWVASAVTGSVVRVQTGVNLDLAAQVPWDNEEELAIIAMILGETV